MEVTPITTKFVLEDLMRYVFPHPLTWKTWYFNPLARAPRVVVFAILLRVLVTL